MSPAHGSLQAQCLASASRREKANEVLGNGAWDAWTEVLCVCCGMVGEASCVAQRSWCDLGGVAGLFQTSGSLLHSVYLCRFRRSETCTGAWQNPCSLLHLPSWCAFPDMLDRSRRTAPGDKEAARPEDNLRRLPQALQMRAVLSKVSEEASSLERDSSGRTDSNTGRSGKGVVVDSHGREGTSKVLGGIHEQVDRRSVPPLRLPYSAQHCLRTRDLLWCTGCSLVKDGCQAVGDLHGRVSTSLVSSTSPPRTGEACREGLKVCCTADQSAGLPQEQEDRRRSSESSEIADPAEQQRWRGHGLPGSVKGGDLGINPHFLQPMESTRVHSSTPGSSSRHSMVSESRLSQVVFCCRHVELFMAWQADCRVLRQTADSTAPLLASVSACCLACTHE